MVGASPGAPLDAGRAPGDCLMGGAHRLPAMEPSRARSRDGAVHHTPHGGCSRYTNTVIESNKETIMRSHPRAACLLAMLTLSATAYAQTPPDVEDLVGARGAGGETQLLSRDYEQRDSNTVRDQRFTFWWNAKKNQCISVSTMEGRYALIQAVPAANCGASDASTPRASTSGERDPNSLVLVCYGAGTRPTVTSEPDYRWDDKRNKWHEADTVRATTEGFYSDVQIELYGDHGRIHLGAPLIPPINSHGDHGWWELDNLQVGPDRITASYRLNGMNKPRLPVDRRSGRINIEGGTTFSGQCDIGNYGGGQRRF